MLHTRPRQIVAGVFIAVLAFVIATAAFDGNNQGYAVDAEYSSKFGNIQVHKTLSTPDNGKVMYEMLQNENGDVIVIGMPGREAIPTNLVTDENPVRHLNSAINAGSFRGETVRVVLVQVGRDIAPLVAMLDGGTVLAINEHAVIVATSNAVRVPAAV